MNIKNKLKVLQFMTDAYIELKDSEEMNLTNTTLEYSIEYISEYISESVVSGNNEEAKKQLTRIMIPICKLYLQL